MSNPKKMSNPWGMELNQYCMLMHLSQFSGFFISFKGEIYNYPISINFIKWD